jgi:predicted RNA-binding Zn-ribbon protein involved in translation (DUF1610 family)
MNITFFVQILGITNHTSKQLLLSKHTRIHIYKTVTRQVLKCGSGSWVIRIAEEVVCFTCRTVGYTALGRNSTLITRELHILY